MRISRRFIAQEWIYVKVPIAIIWLAFVLSSFFTYQNQPFSAGICQLFDCSFISREIPFWLLVVLFSGIAILYILEKEMLITTLLMGIFMLICFSLEESNGILSRGLFTAVFFAQFFAYAFHRLNWIRNIEHYRLQFSAQIVAAAYFLSALSKLSTSGFHWPSDGYRMAIQILKSFNYNYFDWGNVAYLSRGTSYANFILEHSMLVTISLSLALLLEFMVPIALFNRRVIFFFGLALLIMHIGIQLLMSIMIWPIVLPMILIFINPFYLLVNGWPAMNSYIARQMFKLTNR
ncbi:MAG: hypothetical protein SFW35_01370 [Chitinophagales bacterium]|nr:hypothetical protein [Chitinophagales bacterium]